MDQRRRLRSEPLRVAVHERKVVVVCPDRTVLLLTPEAAAASAERLLAAARALSAERAPSADVADPSGEPPLASLRLRRRVMRPSPRRRRR